mgnify:CR=1 FL=1
MSYLTDAEMAAEGIMELQVIWTPEHEPAWLATMYSGEQVILEHDEDEVLPDGGPARTDRFFWLAPPTTII